MSAPRDPATLRQAEHPPFANNPARACAEQGIDPEVFFPRPGKTVRSIEVKQAKAICRRCPLTDECAGWAIRTNQKFGIWGGTTPNERTAIRRPMRKTSDPVVHLIRHDQAVTDCCSRSPADLPRRKGHHLTAQRDRATCPALVPLEDTTAPDHCEPCGGPCRDESDLEDDA